MISFARRPHTNSPTHLQLSRFAWLRAACWASAKKSRVCQSWYRYHRTLRLLCGCRIDHRPNSRDPVRRKTTLLGMLTYCVFIGRHVYAVDFVVRDVALNPLNLSAHLSQNSARLLRYCPELLRRESALFWNFSFDNELRHGNTSCPSFSGEEFDYLISASAISTIVQRWARPPSAL
jgi:hypothetical protein